MQQQELQIKAQEQQRKSQKDAADIQIAQAKLMLERERIGAQAQTEAKRTATEAIQAQDKLNADIFKHAATHAHEKTKHEKDLLAKKEVKPKKGE